MIKVEAKKPLNKEQTSQLMEVFSSGEDVLIVFEGSDDAEVCWSAIEKRLQTFPHLVMDGTFMDTESGATLTVEFVEWHA